MCHQVYWQRLHISEASASPALSCSVHRRWSLPKACRRLLDVNSRFSFYPHLQPNSTFHFLYPKHIRMHIHNWKIYVIVLIRAYCKNKSQYSITVHERERGILKSATSTCVDIENHVCMEEYWKKERVWLQGDELKVVEPSDSIADLSGRDLTILCHN